MNKLKTYLIHLLGGKTQAEVEELWEEGFALGFKRAFYSIKLYTEDLNGTPAEEWCKKVYNYIINRL